MNKIDEQGRFRGLETHLVPIARPVCDTHGISYLGARKMYQEMGETMAFDKSICRVLIEVQGYIPGYYRFGGEIKR